MDIDKISLDVQDKITKEKNINDFLEMLSFDMEKKCCIIEKKGFETHIKIVNESIYKTFNKIKNGKYVENYYYSPNDGKIIEQENKYGGKFKVESKKEEDIQHLKTFYIDIDFKDEKGEKGEHYPDDILLKKKEEMLERLKRYWKEHIIVRPNIIFESKNGFHLYYVIRQDHIIESEEKLRKRKENEKILSEALDWDFSKLDDIEEDHINRVDELTIEEWKLLENRIYLMYKYGLEIKEVDPAVRKPGQLLRLPYSIHKKTGQTSFETRILFIAKPMSLLTIILSFRKEACECYKNDNKSCLTSNEKNDTRKESKSCLTSSKLSAPDENQSELINKIKNLDVQYFKENVGEVQHQVFDDRHEAIDYIVRQDMSKLLNIKYPENFSSPFRVDNTPSCRIFRKKDGIYRFYDRAQKDAIQGSILDIIQQVANVSLTKAVDFLAEVYNVETSSFQPYMNFSQLEDIIHYNEDLFSENIKLNKLNKKLIILYKECLEFWKEKCIENESIPFMKHDIMISNNTMFEKLQEKYLDGNPFKRPQDLTRRFMQLEALGVVKLIRGKNFNIETKTRAARVYQFKKINANEFSIKCMILKRKCPNIREMSEKVIKMVDMSYQVECKKQLISKLTQIIKNIK